MSMFSNSEEYDYAITVFSPEGRLFQVEYALEMVKRGSTVLGIACPEGVVFAAELASPSPLQVLGSTRKIFPIDEHVGVAIAGLSADARILVDRARIDAQNNRLTYDEPIDIAVLAHQLADIKQQYTQYGGVRPFGVSLIIGGIDHHGSRIFQTDPSGSCVGYASVAIGSGGDAVHAFLETHRTPPHTVEQAIQLAIACLSQAMEGGLDVQKLSLAIIPTSTQRFHTLTADEVYEAVQRAQRSSSR